MQSTKLVQNIAGLSLIVQIDRWPEQSVTPHLWDTAPYDPGGCLYVLITTLRRSLLWKDGVMIHMNY